MEVFQYEHERILRCQCFQGLANFTHHALARSSEDLLLQRLPLFGLYD